MKYLTYLVPFLFLAYQSCESSVEEENVQSTTDSPIDEVRKDSVLFDCYDGSQTEMNICSYNEFLYYDSIMNQKSDSVLKLMDQELPKLKSSEYDAVLK